MITNNGPIVSRRSALIGGLSAATAAAGSLHEIASATPAKRGSSTFLLVHGAWHGGWCWQRSADILSRAGHTVHAPTLTGLCERSHLLTQEVDLSVHIQDVVNEIKWKDLDQIVLVGHSYGGMVITGVAEQVFERIASIVYLDAFIPQSGQSLADIRMAPAPSVDPIPPPPASVFAINSRDAAWVDSKLTAQPRASFTQRLSHNGAYDRIGRKRYVRALKAPAVFFDEICRPLRSDASWNVDDLKNAGHDLMLDQPAQVAELLMASA